MMILFTIFLLSCLNIAASTIRGGNGLDPIQQLMQSSFPVMDQYMPSEKDLKIKKLVRRLGDDFIPEWMSIKKPGVSGTETTEDSVVSSENAEYIRTLETELELNNNTKQKLITLMQGMLECKTTYVWKRLEPLFWPKYIKEGNCVEKKHCSVKSSMKCRMGNEKPLRVLHWSCRKRKGVGNKKNRKHNSRFVKNMKLNLRSKLKCKWRKIIYNVNTKCECSCR